MKNQISHLRRQKILNIINEKQVFDYKNLLFFQGLNELYIDEPFFYEVEKKIHEKYDQFSREDYHQQWMLIFSHPDCPNEISMRNIQYVDAQKMASFNEEQMKYVIEHKIDSLNYRVDFKNVIENLCQSICLAEEEKRPFPKKIVEQLIGKILELCEQDEKQVIDPAHPYALYYIIDKVSPMQFKRFLQLENINKREMLEKIITKENESMKEKADALMEVLRSDKNITDLMYASPYCPKRLITSLLKKTEEISESDIGNENLSIFLRKISYLSANPNLSKLHVEFLTSFLVDMFDKINKKEMTSKTSSSERTWQSNLVENSLLNLISKPIFDEEQFIESLSQMEHKGRFYLNFAEWAIIKYKNIIDEHNRPTKKIFDFFIDVVLKSRKEISFYSNQWVINHPFLNLEKKKGFIKKTPGLMNEDMFKSHSRKEIEFLLGKSIRSFIEEHFVPPSKANEYHIFSEETKALLKWGGLGREEIEPIFSAFLDKIQQEVAKNESRESWNFCGLLYQQKNLMSEQKIALLEWLNKNMKINHEFMRKNYEVRPSEDVKNFFNRIVEHSDTKTKIFLLSSPIEDDPLDSPLYRPVKEFIHMLILEHDGLPRLLKRQFDKEPTVEYHRQNPSFF